LLEVKETVDALDAEKKDIEGGLPLLFSQIESIEAQQDKNSRKADDLSLVS
jgi:hypothetical protein